MPSDVRVAGALLLLVVPLQGCTTPEPTAASDCPPPEGGFLAIAVQEGGIAPHPEVYTLEADGLATGVVLAPGGNESSSSVGFPPRSLHNVTEDEVRRVLRAADVPEQNRWNVTRAYQALVGAEVLEEACRALSVHGPELEPRYPDEECRDGTTLTVQAWTPKGLVVSRAECEAGQDTAFEEVRLALRNATLAAQERAGVAS